MSNAIPTVGATMTPSPHAIEARRSLTDARSVMREHHIRHLPVLSDGKLVGILTDRDLTVIEALRDIDLSDIAVADAMSASVYVVKLDEQLDVVVGEMARHKYESAIVVKDGMVAGIFTTVDVCKAFAKVLQGSG